MQCQYVFVFNLLSNQKQKILNADVVPCEQCSPQANKENTEKGCKKKLTRDNAIPTTKTRKSIWPIILF